MFMLLPYLQKWTKFGKAAGYAPGPDGSQTTISDDVYLMLKSKHEVCKLTPLVVEGPLKLDNSWDFFNSGY